MMLIRTRSASVVYLIHASVVIKRKIFLFLLSLSLHSIPRAEKKTKRMLEEKKKKTLTTCNVVFYCNMLLLSRKVPFFFFVFFHDVKSSPFLDFFLSLSFSRTAIVHYFEKRAKKRKKERKNRERGRRKQDHACSRFSSMMNVGSLVEKEVKSVNILF